MTPGQASQTAQFVAMQRAHHHLFAPEPKLLEDHLALPISGLADGVAVKAAMDGLIGSFAQLGSRDVAAAFVEQIEHSVCGRSRVVEHRLQQRQSSGLGQVLILGAGLDTLAFRRADLLAEFEVIEVDHPDTQGLKRSALARANIDVPENVRFVAFDFENQTLGEALAEGGVDPQVPALFTWLGVNMYLTDETVKATLKVLGGFAKGSEAVMDFVPEESATLENAVEDSITQLRKVVEQMGEPMKSRYKPEALESRLREAGFSQVEFYSAKRIVDEVLGGVRGSYCMPDEAVSILAATV